MGSGGYRRPTMSDEQASAPEPNLTADDAVGRILLTEEQLTTRIREIGAQITEDYSGKRPLLVCVAAEGKVGCGLCNSLPSCMCLSRGRVYLRLVSCARRRGRLPFSEYPRLHC